MICAFASRSISRELIGRDGLVMAEVEAQALGRDERPGLLHVRTEHLAQRPVQHVGRGVIAPDTVAAHTVDRGGDRVAFAIVALPHDRIVHDDDRDARSACR